MSFKSYSPILTGALFGLLLAGPLAAQSRLYIQEPDDKFHAVFKVDEIRPYIMDGGKLAPAKGQRLAMKKVEEYLPLFIGVSDFDARPTNSTADYSYSPTNNGVHFSAKFESRDALDDVFLVLEMVIPNVGNKLFTYEIGRLEPWTPKSFSAELPMGQYMGSGTVVIHLFCAGSEVFTSALAAAEREALLDQMIARRVAATKDAGPRPLFGSAPEYPAALRTSGLKGEAVVSLRVTAQGAVENPVVERASEPAFGEAALQSVRQWRFVPQVQGGHAVERKVSIPFAFEPPATK